jgi:S-DNA-T family DNA segregation ATPase FtsK/SpoIIIE
MARKTSSSKSTRSSSSRSKSSRSSKSSSKSSGFQLSTPQKALAIGVFVIFSTAVLTLSLLAPNQGQLTSWLSSLLGQTFGWGAYLIPLISGALGLYLVLWGMEQPPKLPLYRLSGVVLLLIVFLTFASMIALMRQPALTDYWQVAQAAQGGGYFGGVFATLVTTLVGHLGAIFAFVVLGIVGAVLVSGLTREDAGRYLRDLFTPDEEAEAAPQSASRAAIPVNPGRGDGAPVQLRLVPSENEAEAAPPPAQTKPPRGRKPQKESAKSAPPTGAPQRETAVPAQPTPTVPGYTWTLPQIADILEAGSDIDLNNAAIREQVEIIEHTLESFGAPATVVEINQGPTVTQFGVEPNYIQMRNGRRTKVKVGKISGLSDDLALALAARAIRIQAPVPGKSYVGIEVPNPSTSLVSLRDVMEAPSFRRIKTSLGLGLGQNVSGESIVADLATMPHLLIAGTTGSGKSVCVNGIIACLLLTNSPADLKLVMIDPKRVELTGYNGIPHLAAPVVVEMDRVISTLQWALREMDRRYQTFSELGVRHIEEYNKRILRRQDGEKMPYVVIIIDELADLMMLAPEDTERAVTRLAQMARATGIHMVIATQRPSVDVVTGLIKANFPARIAFAVASGTDSRVILDSTGAERLLGQGDMLFQKPDSPAPLRLQGCFVSDAELSKLISYWKAARRTNIITADSPPPTAAAGAPTLASPPAQPAAPSSTATAEPGRAVPRSRPRPPAPPQSDPASETSRQSAEPTTSAPPPRSAGAADSGAVPVAQPLWEALQEEAEKPEYVDELMPEAIALVRKLNKASTSLLQRRFRIGYTRAARIIDAMEEMDVIGPPTGTSKAREVVPAGGEDGQTDETSASAAEGDPEPSLEQD